MTDTTTLLTGGTGKTGKRIAARLAEMGHRIKIASRRVNTNTASPTNVRFDWADTSTYNDALADVSAIYLVAPENAVDLRSAMQPFLERALASGVKRFVLLSASSLEEGDPMMGDVHSYLKHNVPEWTVLRPTWFMQNFSELQHFPTIRDEGRIYSATADGRVPFVDADDIAAVGVTALTNARPYNRDVIITGPESISYSEVATTISNAIGRSVEHIRLSEQELVERYCSFGMEASYAQVLAAMDTAIAKGSENRVSSEVATITGNQPNRFRDFVDQNHLVWNTGDTQ